MLRRFLTRDAAPSKDQIGRVLLPDQRRQRRRRHRRIASQLDFRKSPRRIVGGVNQVADHRQLRASAQAMAMHGGDRHFLAADQGPNHGVKLGQHVRDFVWSVRGNVHANRERFARAAQYQRWIYQRAPSISASACANSSIIATVNHIERRMVQVRSAPPEAANSSVIRELA